MINSNNTIVYTNKHLFYEIVRETDGILDAKAYVGGHEKDVLLEIREHALNALEKAGLDTERRNEPDRQYVCMMINGRIYEYNVKLKEGGFAHEKTISSDEAEVFMEDELYIPEYDEIPEEQAGDKVYPADEKDTKKKEEDASLIVDEGTFAYNDFEFDEWELTVGSDKGDPEAYHVLILPLYPKEARKVTKPIPALVVAEYDGTSRYGVNKPKAENYYHRIRINKKTFETTCRYENGVLNSGVELIGEDSLISTEVGSLHSDNKETPGHPVIRVENKLIHLFPIPHVFEYELPDIVVCIESDKDRKVFCVRKADGGIKINVSENITVMLNGSYDSDEDYYNYRITRV